ncbi:MAG: glucose-1-phosphate adenylyltransferase, partial [Clostridia bacterium]|nr:glucose-1-phosphate adenylyltransferase [Clostridia bacterium]
ILSSDAEGRITKFEEKPKQSDSTTASMGIYIFSRRKLFSYLKADAEDPKSENDFGKNIIPAMLAAGERMFAYPFEGYWKDVGTLGSLWEANMDLLDNSKTPIRLNDSNRRIFSRSTVSPPHYVADGAVVENSILTDGDVIRGKVINSVLSPDVTVEEGAEVTDSVIMGSSVIRSGAKVRYSIIDSHVVIGKNAVIGADRTAVPDVTLIGAHVVIAEGETVPGGAIRSKKKEASL